MKHSHKTILHDVTKAKRCKRKHKKIREDIEMSLESIIMIILVIIFLLILVVYCNNTE
ncbi:MAG: hypothetical protein O7D30_00680 [Rickettsia endosymbiont of Ixodes persulcatus]|nr:hypothetical protein [Rickettsia endosymbiont of Ixodes persulcatus]